MVCRAEIISPAGKASSPLMSSSTRRTAADDMFSYVGRYKTNINLCYRYVSLCYAIGMYHVEQAASNDKCKGSQAK